MKLINYKSKWFFWLLLIKHTVLVCKWKVLSYELDYPFWPWRFYGYTENQWKDNVRVITYEKSLPDIDIEKYVWRKDIWVWCFEALAPILKENNIDIMKTVNNRIYKIVFISACIVFYSMWYFTYDLIDNMRYDIIIID